MTSGGRPTVRLPGRAHLEEARAGLLAASARLAAEGVPGTAAEGQLIRPLVALAGSSGGAARTPAFWDAVLAIQLAHEASLLHDDVVDRAGTRRGVPTLAAERGIPVALLAGDHLLTAGYRAAARTGDLEFVSLYARAVERTVAGEGAQGRAAGERLDLARYEQIVLGKSGELIGCALAVGPLLERRGDAATAFELGRRVGLLYQMLDDLLDYCPSAATGKDPLSDFRQRRWTWPLEEVPEAEFGMGEDALLVLLHEPGEGESPMRRALARLEREAALLRGRICATVPRAEMLEALITGWVERAGEAVRAEARARPAQPVSSPLPHRSGRALPRPDDVLAARTPALADVDGYLSVHSRSFRFASRFFPPADAARIARVYAYCRVTDDLVDRPEAGMEPAGLLDLWEDRSRRGYDGAGTGIPLLDRVMGEMADAGVPFDYAAELIEGMRMDLRGERYATLADLRRYTYRAASVVGLWLTRSFGVHAPAVLERAERMGHAMQLTNILRDVGEDWREGRLYLPLELLRKHGLAGDELDRMCAGAPVGAPYAWLIEELLRVAEADYRAGLDALPALPRGFARPVAVAAHVYRGIHGEIRRAGYDNIRRRAVTSRVSKVAHAARALWEIGQGASAPAVPGGAPAIVAGAARK